MLHPPFQLEQTPTGWRFVFHQRITPTAGTWRQRLMRVLGTPLAAALLPGLYFILFDAWVQANDINGALYGVGLSGALIPLLIVGRIRAHWAPRMFPVQLEIRSSKLIIDAWTRTKNERTLVRWKSTVPLHSLSDGTESSITFNGPQKERFLSLSGPDGPRIIPHLQFTQANGKQLVSHLNSAITDATQRHGLGQDEVPEALQRLQERRPDTE